MTGIRLGVAALALALAGIGSGCASLSDPMHHEDTFKEHSRKFTQYIRWGNLYGAALYVTEEQRDAFLDLAPALEDMRFTDYEMLRQEMSDDAHTGTVDVVFTGYRLSSPIARTVRLHQDWKRVSLSKWEVSVGLEPMREALGLAAK